MHPEQMLKYATQFRLPLTSQIGGFGEVTIQRGEGSQYHDKWAVTDGSFTGLRAWIDPNGWQHITDVGRAAAYRLTLEEAFTLAGRVVEIESACMEAEISVIRDL